MSDQKALKNKLEELARNKEEFLSIIVEACKRHGVSINFDHKFYDDTHNPRFTGSKNKLDLQWQLSLIEIQDRLNEIRLNEDIAIKPWKEGKWIYGMTSNGEQTHYTDVARYMRFVDGCIVDAGCWMGSTTISLVRGCIDFIETQKIIAIDRFIWEEWMNYTIGQCNDYKADDDFMPEFQKRMGDYLKHVIVVKTDLTSYTWSGDPVKILLIDAMKSPCLAENISKQFYPSLVLKSIVIQQDFKHFYHSWIFVLHYRLREYFTVIFEVNDSTTVSFKLVKQIPQYIITNLPNFYDISDKEIDDVFEWVESILRPESISSIVAAKVMTYCHLQRFDEIDKVFLEYAGRYSEEDVKEVKSRIVYDKKQYELRTS